MIMDHNNKLFLQQEAGLLGLDNYAGGDPDSSGQGNLAAEKPLRDITGQQGMVIALAGTGSTLVRV